MNYRILGLIAMMGAPCVFLKMALGGFTFNSVHPLIIICNVCFYISLFSSITGLLKLSTSSFDSSPKYILLIEICLLSVAAWFSLLTQGKSAHLYYTLMEACRTASNILLIIVGSIIIFSGKSEMWKKYLRIISSVWLILSILFASLLPSSEALLVCTMALSGIISSLLGYHIYNSEDPEIANENMLYEISSL
ncbi:MAG: hypothetical protein ACJ748_06160 [Flavisolibacter sp.]